MTDNSESQQRGLPSFIGSFFNTSGYNDYVNKPHPLPEKTFDTGYVVINNPSVPPYSNNYNTNSTLPPNFSQMDSSSPIPPSFQQNQTSVIPPYGSYQSVLPPSFTNNGWDATSGWNPVPSQSWDLNAPSIQTTPPSEYVKFSLSTLTSATPVSTAPSAPPVELVSQATPTPLTSTNQPISTVQPAQVSTPTPSSGLNLPPPVVSSTPLSPLAQHDLPLPPPLDLPMQTPSAPIDACIPAPPPPPPTNLKSATTSTKITPSMKPTPVKSCSHEDMLMELQNGRNKLKQNNKAGIVKSNSDDLLSTLSSALDARFSKIRKSQEEEDEIEDQEFVDKSIGRNISSPAVFRSN